MTFTRLDIMKKHWPNHPFYVQGWVYAGISSYFSQQGKFDQLEFTDQINEQTTVFDYNHNTTYNNGSCFGLAAEGHHDYWCVNVTNKLFSDCVIVTGHEHHKVHDRNNISIGFDYWDIYTYQKLVDAILSYEINQTSVAQAEYDVVIPIGAPRAHRIKFAKLLEESHTNLSIVTDNTQKIINTDLRFSALGIEVYFNKFGITNFRSHVQYQNFYDTNETRQLDHYPHKKMYSIARVCVALETTVYNTDQSFLTEKTWKILANNRPFVIFGDTNALTKLKNQGFKTFEKYCDESYDKETDLHTRALKCITAINQLSAACKTHPEEIDSICRHNYQLFFDIKRHTNNLARFGRLCLDQIYKEESTC